MSSQSVSPLSQLTPHTQIYIYIAIYTHREKVSMKKYDEKKGKGNPKCDITILLM